MTTRYISGTIITNGYTLSGAYSSLSISSTGTIDGMAGANGAAGLSGAAGGVALTLPSAAYVNNAGMLVGGAGGLGGNGTINAVGAGGAGGNGIDLSGRLLNTAVIAGGVGGNGGAGTAAGSGGAGGVAISSTSYVVVYNRGTLKGGAGGADGKGTGGAGGAGGAAVSMVGFLGNYGVIQGGAAGVGASGTGGAGVALLSGAFNNSGSIFGGTAALAGLQGDGVVLGGASGGAILSNDSSSAYIGGVVGVYVGTTGNATVINFGTIKGDGGIAVQLKSSGDRLIAEAGSTWLGAVKANGGALELASGTGTLTSLGATGTVSGAEAMTFSGFGYIDLGAGSSWTLTGANSLTGLEFVNVYGTVANTGHLYGGGYGATADGYGFCPIFVHSGAFTNRLVTRGGAGATDGAGNGGYGGDGVFIKGGQVVNAAGAQIYGGNGGAAGSGAGNYAGGGGDGALLESSAALANYGLISGGQSGTGGALGGDGVLDIAGGLITNAGTIRSGAGVATHLWTEAGIDISQSGTLINGSSSSHSALISGYAGIYASPNALVTVTNFGTIAGSGKDSVVFKTSSDRLIAGVGAKFVGMVLGAGGTLELAGGTGAISGMGATGTISNAVSMTFSGFGSYQFDTGSSWTIEGTAGIGQAQHLTIENGAVASIAGAITSAGALVVDGSISGSGALNINGGVMTVGAGGSVSVAKWVENAGTTIVDGNLTYRGAFTEGNGVTLIVGVLDRLTLAGTAVLAGYVNGPGSMTVLNATVGNFTIEGKSSLAASGTVVQTGYVAVGDGVTGLSTLSILKSGVWEIGANSISSLSISTGKITNYGSLIANAGTGTAWIGVDVTNNGMIEAASGRLEIRGKQFGTGVLKIDAGARLQADALVFRTLTVDFNGAGSTLAMRYAKTFSASIGGFAAGDTIDLLSTRAASASINGSDQLVITAGKFTVAALQLTGSYSGATFTVGSDGNGGTDVTLVSASSQLPSPHLLTAAMAAMAPEVSAGISGQDPRQSLPPVLAAPGR